MAKIRAPTATGSIFDADEFDDDGAVYPGSGTRIHRGRTPI